MAKTRRPPVLKLTGNSHVAGSSLHDQLKAHGFKPYTPGMLLDPGKGAAAAVGRGVSSITTGWIRDLVPILKIGAGGFIMLVAGGALVYVAGKQTGATSAAVGVAEKVVPAAAARRKALGTRKASARADVARREASDRVRITRGGRSGYERVSTTSRRSGAGVSKARANPEKPRVIGAQVPTVRARRRPAPKVSA